MACLYLSLGTNLGDKENNLRTAIQYIEKQIGEIDSLSAFYVTAPWGFDSSHTFLNAAVSVHTTLTPLKILEITQQIEKEMGRQYKTSQNAYQDRIIDIDLLLYDNLILQDTSLTLPHPLMTERLFVMEPLAEIAPNVIHPLFNQSIQDLYSQLKLKEESQDSSASF